MKAFPLALGSALALMAAPALADGHGPKHDEGHGEHSVLDTATFMKHHGEALSGAINHPTRKDDRARDQHRHPAETLAFFHVGPHMKVGEYAPGGGWYSRLLGHYLGGEGQLVGIYANPVNASSDPAWQPKSSLA
jgi:predicted methyltransferase